MSTSTAPTASSPPAAAPAEPAAELARPSAATPVVARRATYGPSGSSRGGRWLRFAAGAVVVLYVLIFARGLGWEWRGIFTATRATVPVVANAPRGASVVAPPAQPAAPSAAQPAAKTPLPPTDEAPPRNATDKYGVFYDQNGVAVTGIDTDPGGVYNVPPGRQVRIGGPQGALFDVEPGGKLKPATSVRQQPQ